MELVFLALLILLMAYALGSGYPVAFALPGSAIISIGAAALCGWLFADNVDAYFAQGSAWQWLSAGVTNFRGVYWEVERDTLIAIPLFIFMGIMLQRSKLAEDLLLTMAQLFGPVPGGLGISVVFVGALLAATTGIVGATVVAMGLISLPVMMRNKYADSLSTGTIAASGTLGQIIPPSIVLIILADQLSSAVDQASSARKGLYKAATGEFSMPSAFDVGSTSAGEMFLGAFVPGLILVGLYMLYILVLALLRPNMAPSVPYHGKFDRKFFIKVTITLVPPLTLIFLVLGSIITGVATVNQAGSIGAAGALIMEQTSDRVAAVVAEIGDVADVGFHGHENLGLGVANTVAAARAGATQIDGSVRRFGAGAGNTPLEAFIGVCDKLGWRTGVDFLQIVDASEDVIKPAMPEECQLDRMTLMMGYAGVYSSFLKHAGNAAERYGVSGAKILLEAGRRKLIGGQEDQLIDIALMLKAEQDKQAANA